MSYLCFLSAGIVTYMQNQVGDPSKEKTVKELQKAFEKDDVTVVGFFAEEDFFYKAYLEAGNSSVIMYYF